MCSQRVATGCRLCSCLCWRRTSCRVRVESANLFRNWQFRSPNTLVKNTVIEQETGHFRTRNIYEVIADWNLETVINCLLDMVAVTILDGGLASELVAAVPDIDKDPLWSARVLETNPEAIYNVHKSFYLARSDVAITATYQASIAGFQEYMGKTVEEALDLMKSAVSIARRAAKDAMKERQGDLKVAGSIGPYGAALHDGSEYTGNYVDNMTKEEIANWHRPRMAALVEAGVDMLAIETIPAQKEAEALVELLREFPQQKAWLSLSCKDGKNTSHGESFAKAVEACLKINSTQLLAVGINCTSPIHISSLLKTVSAIRDQVPFVVYPNTGEDWIAGTGWLGREGHPPVEKFVEDWLNAGVRYIGGCCRTTPYDITRIHKIVQKWSGL